MTLVDYITSRHIRLSFNKIFSMSQTFKIISQLDISILDLIVKLVKLLIFLEYL